MAATFASPAAVADKWVSRMGASSTAYKDGIERVSENPMEKAAAAGQAYIEGCQRAEQSGKRAASLRRVTLQDWKTAAITKGASRIASGAAAAKSKMQNFLQSFLPHLAAGVEQVRAMPRGSFEQNMARAMRMAEHNHNFRGR